MSVQYAAFGAMAITVDGASVPLTRRRERGVLAVLLAAHGAPVPAERLVAEVWGDEAPGQTLASLQVAVSRLRSQLEPDRAARSGSRLVSTAAGYSLVAEADDVDTWRFEALAEQALAATAPEERLRLTDAARALWTSTPYADCDAPMVRSETNRLEELELTLAEVRARALLDLSRPDEALRGLAELAPRHPYRERMWSLLALAQYQCARQADALDTLRRLREQLAEELGVDPSEEIQRLEQAVLRQDPELSVPVPATTPSSPRTGRIAPVRSATGTVGRAAALETALAVVEDARTSGRTSWPRFLLVAGEPGIGKSRLVTDVSDAATADGFRVLVGRCHEGDYAPALWPWLSIVRALIESERAAGAEVDPLLEPLLDDTLTDTRAGAGSGLRMFDAVVELVSRGSARSPLLLVLEDVHWADATSLQLLRHLATAGTSMPVAVLCTRRTTEASTGEALVDTLAVLAQAGAERLRLDGLDDDSVGALLTAAVGEHDAQLGRFVAEVTGGNPFFVLQYARQLAGVPDLEHVDPTSLPVPDGIRDVLRQRIGRLPGDVVRTLTSAAVLGRYLDPDLVAELAGVPVEECLDQLDLAMTSGLVEDQDAGYVFVHALARESLYAEVSAARRMRLHDRAGRLIEARQVHAADAISAIAHHAHLAAPLGPEHAERAASWLARAAGVASGRHAHAEALGLWQQALDDVAPDSPAMAEALCGQAAALLRLARAAEARSVVEVAIRLARRLDRPDLTAAAAGILNGAGVWSWREHGVLDHEFTALLRDAADATTDPAERAQLLATLQVELYYGWNAGDGDRVGAESVELARRSGDQDLLVQILLVRLLAAWGPARATERLALVEELLAQEPEGEMEVFALFHHAGALYESFEVERADEVMTSCADKAAALRHTGLEIQLAWWWFARALDREDPAARSLGEAAAAVHRAMGYIAMRDLEILAATRLLEPGEPVPEWVVTEVRSMNPGLRGLVAHAVLESGDPATAYDLLGEPAPADATEYTVVAGRCFTVAVLAETGSPKEIRAALAHLEPFAGRVATYGSVDHLGVVDYFLARGYAALGDPRALERARQAVVLDERLGCLLWKRRAEELLARLQE